MSLAKGHAHVSLGCLLFLFLDLQGRHGINALSLYFYLASAYILQFEADSC